jgi:urease accessory protein
MRASVWGAALAGAVMTCTGTVWAHTGIGSPTGPWAAFGHPWGGLYHVLAMVAVGLWAAQVGGRAVYLLPASFLSIMAVAALVGAGGTPPAGVEIGLALSVVGLGILVALGVVVPVAAAMALVGVFAAFHGHAHGTEMLAGATWLVYGAGFLGATALLHGVGLALGRALVRYQLNGARRAAGCAMAGIGVLLLVG